MNQEQESEAIQIAKHIEMLNCKIELQRKNMLVIEPAYVSCVNVMAELEEEKACCLQKLTELTK